MTTCDKLDFDLEFWESAGVGTVQRVRLTRESCELTCRVVSAPRETVNTYVRRRMREDQYLWDIGRPRFPAPLPDAPLPSLREEEQDEAQGIS